MTDQWRTFPREGTCGGTHDSIEYVDLIIDDATKQKLPQFAPEG